LKHVVILEREREGRNCLGEQGIRRGKGGWRKIYISLEIKM
jgi:hypothetical protein